MHHVEQRSDTRHHVLAGGGGRREHRVIAIRQSGNQRRDVFRQVVGIGGILRQQNLRYTRDLRGGIGSRFGIIPASDEDMHIAAQLGCGSDGGVGRIGDLAVCVIGNNKSSHQATPRALSLATSASTSATSSPA